MKTTMKQSHSRLQILIKAAFIVAIGINGKLNADPQGTPCCTCLFNAWEGTNCADPTIPTVPLYVPVNPGQNADTPCVNVCPMTHPDNPALCLNPVQTNYTAADVQAPGIKNACCGVGGPPFNCPTPAVQAQWTEGQRVRERQKRVTEELGRQTKSVVTGVLSVMHPDLVNKAKKKYAKKGHDDGHKH